MRITLWHFFLFLKKKYQYMYIDSARQGLQRDHNVWCFYLEIRKMISVPLSYQKHWSVFTQSEHWPVFTQSEH